MRTQRYYAGPGRAELLRLQRILVQCELGVPLNVSGSTAMPTETV